MRILREDYVNAVLDTTENTKTVYEMEEVETNKYNFTDVSKYSVTGDTWGANDINQTNAQVNSLGKVDSITLSADGWSNTVPYAQQVALTRITADDKPLICIGNPPSTTANDYKAHKKAFACIEQVISTAGHLTFYCYNKKPTTTINVFVKGV